MKLKNIFKKPAKVMAKSNTQVLDKTQIERIVGGTDESSGGRWQQSGIGHTIVVK